MDIFLLFPQEIKRFEGELGIIRMGEPNQIFDYQLFPRISQHLAVRIVDFYQNTVKGRHRHAQAGLIERLPEPCFTLAQLLLHLLTVRDIARQQNEAFVI